MNTRTRRFVLRLIVGLLTFLIGVIAAMVLGNFNPFEARQVRPRARRCAEYARSAPKPSITVPVRLPDAPLAPRPALSVLSPQSRLSQTPLRPQAAEPVLPSFEDQGEVKSPKSVVRSHASH